MENTIGELNNDFLIMGEDDSILVSNICVVSKF